MIAFLKAWRTHLSARHLGHLGGKARSTRSKELVFSVARQMRRELRLSPLSVLELR